MFVDFQGRGLIEVFQQRIVGSKAPNMDFLLRFLLYVPGWRQWKFPRLFVCLGFFEKELSNEKKTGCLGCIGDYMDYATQLYGDFNKPIYGSL